MRRTTALALTAATALLLGACTGGGDDAAPTDGGTASADERTPGAPAAPVTGGATPECVTGEWQLDLAAMEDDLRALFATGGDDAGVELIVEGTTSYTFAEGGAFTADVDSSSTVTFAGEGAELTSSSTSNGTLAGTWALEGDQLTVADVDPGALQVTTRAQLDGEKVDVPPGTAEDTIEALPPTLSTVGCSDDRMSLVAALATDEESEPVSVTYTLTR